jgi:hypothetical protein
VEPKETVHELLQEATAKQKMSVKQDVIPTRLSKSRGLFHNIKENAPWPGFEPGSGGRQPPILDRTILPGLSVGQDVDSIMEIWYT